MKSVLAAIVLAAFSMQAFAQDPNTKLIDWTYSRVKDPATKTTTRKAVLASKEPLLLPYPFEASLRGFLSISREGSKPSEVRLWVSPGQIPCQPICEITVHFDKKKPVTLTAEPGADGAANAIRFQDGNTMIKGLRGARVTKLEVPLGEAGMQRFEFKPNIRLSW